MLTKPIFPPLPSELGWRPYEQDAPLHTAFAFAIALCCVVCVAAVTAAGVNLLLAVWVN